MPLKKSQIVGNGLNPHWWVPATNSHSVDSKSSMVGKRRENNFCFLSLIRLLPYFLTAGDLTTLKNLTEMGEGQRQARSCWTRAAQGAKRPTCSSSGIGWWTRARQVWTRPRAATAGKRQTGRKGTKGTWPSHACAGVHWTPVVGLWNAQRRKDWSWIRLEYCEMFLKTVLSSYMKCGVNYIPTASWRHTFPRNC